MEWPSRTWWSRVRQIVQLLGLVVDEVVKLVGVFRGGR
jgi:hypothetical protein